MCDSDTPCSAKHCSAPSSEPGTFSSSNVTSTRAPSISMRRASGDERNADSAEEVPWRIKPSAEDGGALAAEPAAGAAAGAA